MLMPVAGQDVWSPTTAGRRVMAAGQASLPRPFGASPERPSLAQSQLCRKGGRLGGVLGSDARQRPFRPANVRVGVASCIRGFRAARPLVQ